MVEERIRLFTVSFSNLPDIHAHAAVSFPFFPSNFPLPCGKTMQSTTALNSLSAPLMVFYVHDLFVSYAVVVLYTQLTCNFFCFDFQPRAAARPSLSSFFVFSVHSRRVSARFG